MTKREFLAASLGVAATAWSRARAASNVRVRKAKTTKLFKAPEGLPNAISVTPEGLWIGEQKLAGEQAKRYGLPQPKTLDEAAWLVDWNGKLLKTVTTPSRNTSGMAVGGGYVWMIANAPPQGVFQVDMNSKLVSHRQIPLGAPGGDGGGSHGGLWHDGKLWLSSLRLRGNLRVDPQDFRARVHDPVPLLLPGLGALPRHRNRRRQHVAGDRQQIHLSRGLQIWPGAL